MKELLGSFYLNGDAVFHPLEKLLKKTALNGIIKINISTFKVMLAGLKLTIHARQ